MLYFTTLCIIFAVVIAAKSHDIDFLYFNIHPQPSVKLQLSLGVDSFTTDLPSASDCPVPRVDGNADGRNERSCQKTM